jgi:thiamine transporter
MNSRIRVTVEVGIVVALSFVLGLVKLWQMPFGGSISLEMIPLFLIACRRGTRIGMTAGLLYGLVNLFWDGFQYVVHPVQLVMDYPLPFALVGLAGLLPKRPVGSVILGGVSRFVVHFLSGIIFWTSTFPQGMNPYLYSALYNAVYIGPELVISAVVIYFLWHRSNIFRPVTG